MENYQVGHDDRFSESTKKLVHLHCRFVLHICVLNFTSTLLAILENILIIRALQKASLIDVNYGNPMTLASKPFCL